MQTDKKNPVADSSKNQANNQQKDAPNENVTAAHEEAINDIEQDPDFSMHSPNDDLDEGETARLGEDNTGLI